jgi:hypothetical protein
MTISVAILQKSVAHYSCLGSGSGFQAYRAYGVTRFIALGKEKRHSLKSVNIIKLYLSFTDASG